MIAHLKGLVLEKGPTEAIIDVNGVGYRVAMSILSLSRLPENGAEVSLRVRTVVREDAFDLYGFLSAVEEDLFLQLTSVSHVGPKMAVSVLSVTCLPSFNSVLLTMALMRSTCSCM